MARNVDITLTAAQRANIATRARQLNGTPVGQALRIEYTKRNTGEVATMEGTYESHTFNSDHGTVVLNTEKGPRSPNLHTITKIVRL